MTVTVLRADSRQLPIDTNTVDLIVTSPPYFGLRSYTDGGAHYAGQVGDEATPAEFINALLEVTQECVRVLKPTGSLWVNLGDKYAGKGGGAQGATSQRVGRANVLEQVKHDVGGARDKSLIGIPWRYALRCIDDLGFILRAEVIWSKPNGLPESVTDRVRRSHEQWFHFVMQPRYYSAVDEIREAHAPSSLARYQTPYGDTPYNAATQHPRAAGTPGRSGSVEANPLGKLPGSVWVVPTEPLQVPERLGVDHFAAFPTEFPRRIIAGWSPSGVCAGCGEGRRPVTAQVDERYAAARAAVKLSTPRDVMMGGSRGTGGGAASDISNGVVRPNVRVVGYACACPDTTAPTTPATVLDVFGGTGTTAHVASALGRHGISVDLSADYCRLAEAPELADTRRRKVLGLDKAPAEVVGQGDLFSDGAA